MTGQPRRTTARPWVIIALMAAMRGRIVWKRLLEEGKFRSAGELAEAEGVTRSFINRLTLLAPDLQEAIIDGRQPKGMQLEELTRTMPAAWTRQQRYLLDR